MTVVVCRGGQLTRVRSHSIFFFSVVVMMWMVMGVRGYAWFCEQII